MENIKLYNAEIIINTLIEVNNKEARTTIYDQNIESYKNALISKDNKDNIGIYFVKNSRLFRKLFNYIYFTDEKNNRYTLLPWYTKENLIDIFRKDKITEEIDFLFSPEVISNLKKREKEETEELQEICEVITDMYIIKIKNKIKEIEEGKTKENKKLIKIYENKRK